MPFERRCHSGCLHCFEAAHNHGAARPQDADQFGRKRNDAFGADVGHSEIDACAAHGVGRPHEGQRMLGELDGDWIGVAGDHFARAEKLRCHGKYSGTRADIEQGNPRPDFALQRFET